MRWILVATSLALTMPVWADSPASPKAAPAAREGETPTTATPDKGKGPTVAAPAATEPKEAARPRTRADSAVAPGKSREVLPPAEQKAFEEGMKGFAESLRQQLTEFGRKFAEEMKRKLDAQALDPKAREALQKAANEAAKAGAPAVPAPADQGAATAGPRSSSSGPKDAATDKAGQGKPEECTKPAPAKDSNPLPAAEPKREPSPAPVK
jgi:hypothetical protein